MKIPEIPNGSYIFYQSFNQVLSLLDRDDRLDVREALDALAFGNTHMPDLSPAAMSVFQGLAPQILANMKKRKDGSKGGRPKGSTKRKTAAHHSASGAGIAEDTDRPSEQSDGYPKKITTGFEKEKTTGYSEKKTTGYSQEKTTGSKKIKPNVNVNDNVNVNANVIKNTPPTPPLSEGGFPTDVGSVCLDAHGCDSVRADNTTGEREISEPESMPAGELSGDEEHELPEGEDLPFETRTRLYGFTGELLPEDDYYDSVIPPCGSAEADNAFPNCASVSADEASGEGTQSETAAPVSDSAADAYAQTEPAPVTTRKRRTTKAEMDPELEDWFENTFWKAYTRKDGKQVAKNSIAKLNPDAELRDKIMAGVERAKQCIDAFRERDMKHIPFASTWLNQRRWEDEPEASPRVTQGTQQYQSRAESQSEELPPSKRYRTPSEELRDPANCPLPKWSDYQKIMSREKFDAMMAEAEKFRVPGEGAAQ